MSNAYWIAQERLFIEAIRGIEIPDAILTNVESITLTDRSEIDDIPVGGGCYWIWTSEPVNHTLHKHRTPLPFDGGEIIYNGIAKDNVKSRIAHHLFGEVDAGWSGISLDIYTSPTRSHRKKCCSITGKVPYLNIGTQFQPIRNKNQLMHLHLSQAEIEHLNSSNDNQFYFRNGIDITDAKHSEFIFRVYFITGLRSIYLEYIEKEWRERHSGLPKLCSYSSGR